MYIRVVQIMAFMKDLIHSTWRALAMGRLMKQISIRSFREHGQAIISALMDITNVLISF